MSNEISLGAKNYSPEQLIKSYLNLKARGLGGANWDAFIYGVAQGEEYLAELARRAFTQLFLSTSEDKYLLRNISNTGFNKPKGLGLSEELLRELCIKVTAEKVTLHSILEVLEVYYGSEALRSTIDSQTLEFYNIKPYSELIIENNKQKILVVFNPENFSDISKATAEEVCGTINYYLDLNKNNSYAKEVINPNLGFKKIRIYSGDLGLGSYLKILGGEAQNSLGFSLPLNLQNNETTSWLIETTQDNFSISGNMARYTYLSGSKPDFTKLSTGDYLNAYGDILNSKNIGTFSITSVSENYFEIENIEAVGQSFTQATVLDLLFFTPVKNTINSNYRVSLAAHADPEVLDILYSTTTQIINRGPTSGAYLKENKIVDFKDKTEVVAGSMERFGDNINVTGITDHNFQVGDKFFLAPGESSFYSGIKTITSITSDGFVYFDPSIDASTPVATINTQYLYSNFRDENGQIVLNTNSSHNLDVDSRASLQEFSINNEINHGSYYKTTVDSSLVTNLYYFASDVLLDGRIIVAGGTKFSGQNKTFFYDKEINTWIAGPNLNFINYISKGVTLNNGRFLFVGDVSCEIYDPELNSWFNIPLYQSAYLYDFAIQKLNDGRVLLTGGTGADVSEIYDPELNSWSYTSSNINYPRNYPNVCKLSDGRVLVSGGADDLGQHVLDTEIYNPYNNTWSNAGSPINPTYYSSSFLILNNNGEIVVPFGGVMLSPGDDTSVYDPIINNWKEISYIQLYQKMASVKFGNKIYFGGGMDEFGNDLNSSIIFDFISNKFTTLPNLPIATSNSVAFYLGEEKILLIGAQLGGIILDLNQINYYGQINNDYIIKSTLNNQIFLKNNFAIFNNAHPIETQSGSKMILFKALEGSSQGPFIFDTKNGLAVTSTRTSLVSQIFKNQYINSIQVSDASIFPESGYLTMDFGKNSEKRNIYYNKKDSTNFYLERPTLFTESYKIGTELIFTKDRFVFNPQNPEDLGSFYLTDSNAGRLAADKTIDEIVASGIKVNKTVLYPNAIGLGNWDSKDSYKVSDKVYVWGDEEEVLEARNGLLQSN